MAMHLIYLPEDAILLRAACGIAPNPQTPWCNTYYGPYERVTGDNLCLNCERMQQSSPGGWAARHWHWVPDPEAKGRE
jgi:hypothetical protein